MISKFNAYRFLTIILVLFAVTILSGCEGSNEVEIRLKPAAEVRGMVYIGGSITMPGYYPVKDTDNLKSILQAVGGISSSADLEHMRLYIPAVGEAGTPQKVDINRAEAWLLIGLPEIGEVTAERIVAYREKNGPFRSINDLTRIEGIGQTTFDKIKDLVTVSE